MRIGYLAEALALAHGCQADFGRWLRLAAPMHDVGKIGIPDAVLKKPGSLTPQEREVMNTHAEIGARILGRSSMPLLQMAAGIALGHHERWDGTGYPCGKSGESIPLSARITAVVDFFDALTMDRCYRPAFDDRTALAMMMRERGRAFDPALVDTFIGHSRALIALRDEVNRRRPSFEAMAQELDALPG